MQEKATEQLKEEVYGTLLTTLEDFVRDIADTERLKTQVTAIRNCIKRVTQKVPTNLRSSKAILHSLRELDCAVDSLDICLSSESVNFPVTCYWVGRCITILADLLIQIECTAERGDDGP
jgi:hypothetical protein